MRPQFTSPLRDERVATWLGLGLGVAFTVCFVTGLISHLVQDPNSWFALPPRPSWIYQLNQGLHVASGIAAIPLLLAKLWTVLPKFFSWPPATSIAHALERAALLPLVGGSLFLLFTGVANINIWRPWEFSFRTGHYAAAWMTVGAMVVHVAAKSHTARGALRRGDTTATPEAPDRRRFLMSVAALSGLATLFTVGQTFAPLRKFALLAPRRPDVGPQGFPVNRLARSVGLSEIDLDAYRLVVDGPGAAEPIELSYADLTAMPQHEARIAIACVEGWSTTQTWSGVRVRDVLARAGAPHDADVTVYALHSGRQSEAPLRGAQAADGDTILALRVNGEILHPDHGFPVRLMGHNRPGVHQTKWVGRLEVHR